MSVAEDDCAIAKQIGGISFPYVAKLLQFGTAKQKVVSYLHSWRKRDPAEFVALHPGIDPRELDKILIAARVSRLSRAPGWTGCHKIVLPRYLPTA